MSGIPQTKGFYFLLHKDPYCTQQAQILGRVKEKWRGSLKPYLISKREIESHWNLPAGEGALSRCWIYSVRTKGHWNSGRD